MIANNFKDLQLQVQLPQSQSPMKALIRPSFVRDQLPGPTYHSSPNQEMLQEEPRETHPPPTLPRSNATHMFLLGVLSTKEGVSVLGPFELNPRKHRKWGKRITFSRERAPHHTLTRGCYVSLFPL